MSEQSSKREIPLPRIPAYHQYKWYFDIVILCLGAVLVIPLILFFMLLVRLTSKGPVIYSQVRCGKDGVPFKMYKIRSMVVDAEKKGVAKWAKAGDPRITRLGNIMRKLHIDELLQVYNVLRGEMTMVGPRPERPEFIAVLKEDVPGYEHRMLVKPGLSGYAQLNYQADAGLEDVHRKVILDLEYVEDASAWLDFRILAATGVQVLIGKVSRTIPLKMFGVYRTAEASHWADEIGLMEEHESVILQEKIHQTTVHNMQELRSGDSFDRE